MSHPSAQPLELARERTIQALCAHFAHDRLTTEEVDERLDRAQRARSMGELEALLADMPPTDLARLGDEPRSYQLAEPTDHPEPPSLLAVLGEVKRAGVWTVPRALSAAAFMGNLTIDLRDALLSPGVTELHVSAVMGEVKVLVPPGVRVECNASAFLASVSDDIHEPAGSGPDTPVIRITGFAFMANIKARLRAPKRRTAG